MSRTLLLLILICLLKYEVSLGQSIFHHLDEACSSFLAESPTPGFAVVVVKDTTTILCKGYGIEKIGSSNPMTGSSISAIGSLTKSFTAMAIMQLVEQGKVGLDNLVTRYLPDFRTANSDRSNKITVRMLLNNTSGLQGGMTNNWIDEDDALENLLTSLQSYYISHEPGTTYKYSNTGFGIAGLIISRVSGLPYHQYIAKNILEPLEMMKSGTDPYKLEAMPLLHGHYPGLKSGIPAPEEPWLLEMIPAGSIFRSTAVDLGRYLLALLQKGQTSKSSVLQLQSLQAMWTPQISFPGLSYEKGGDDKHYHYGLGWMISEIEGRTIIHHGGSNRTMSSMTMIDTTDKIAVSVLLNIDFNFLNEYRYPTVFNLVNNLLHIVRGEPSTKFGIPREPDPTNNHFNLPTQFHDRYTGHYQQSYGGDGWTHQGALIEIDKQGNDLFASCSQTSTLISAFKLDFVHEGLAISRNIAPPENIRFKIGSDRDVSGLFYADSFFKKLKTESKLKYQRVELGAAPIRFNLPINWMVTNDGDQIKARDSSKHHIIFKGEMKNEIPSKLVTILKQEVPQHDILLEGVLINESRGRHRWIQQSFLTSSGAERFQHLLLICYWKDRYFVGHFQGDPKEFTSLIQPAAKVILESMTTSP